MKLLATLSIAWFTALAPHWVTDFNTAKQEATQQNKAILISFSGSDWCGPCIRMEKEIFESAAFVHYASDNLVLVKADFPRERKNQLSKDQEARNEALADRYNPEGKFPLTVLVNADGKVLKEWQGLPQKTPEQFIQEIQSTVAGGNINR
jgi:thioredoxin-related protein